MISKRMVLFGCACITAAMLWPAKADAQWAVSVGVGFGHYHPYYHPYYRPYYYGGFYPFYSPFYSPFYGPYWYGAYYQYPGYYYGRPYSSARIEVKPRSAQVFLDGYYVGVVDQFDGVFQRLDLPTGEHELTVYLPGYRSYKQKTLFRPGEGYHFKAILEPLASGEANEPQPQPTAADPYREPQDPRYRDPRDQNPPPGDPRDPNPPPGDPREQGRTRPLPERSGDRRAPANPEFGTLNVRVQPADAVVIIDGERWDSPEGGSRLIVELFAGSHKIEVRKEGFKTYTATLQIRPGQTETLNISLPPG